MCNQMVKCGVDMRRSSNVKEWCSDAVQTPSSAQFVYTNVGVDRTRNNGLKLQPGKLRLGFRGK